MNPSGKLTIISLRGLPFFVSLVLVALLVSCSADASGEVDERAVQRYADALAAYADSDTDGAIRLARQSIEIVPGFTPALFLLGKLFVLEERGEEAEPILLTLLEEEPTHVDARKWLARLYLIRGDAAEARSVLTPALRVSTDDPEILIEMARIHREQGDLTSALEYYTKALAFSDRLAIASMELAEIYGAYGMASRAVRSLERARDLAEPSGLVHTTIRARLDATTGGDR